MQKKIIALAIAAAFAAPVAMAETVVYGSIDAGLRSQNNDTAASKESTMSMQLGQWNSARWGIKSVEDLGDGMKATVVLEGTPTNPVSVSDPLKSAGQNSTTGAAISPGTALFDREARVGVSGGFGAIDFGYTYTASFKVIKAYDPMEYKLLAIAGAKTSDYQDRAGGIYYSNKFGDIAINADYYMDNSSKQTKANAMGSGMALGAVYASSGLTVGGAYTSVAASPVAVGAANGETGKLTNMTVGAGYDFGDFVVSGGYAKETTAPVVANAANADATDTNMWVGGKFKASNKLNATLAVYKNTSNSGVPAAADSDKQTIILSVDYSLSKKTTVYAAYDTATTTKTGSADSKISGVSVGLNVNF